MNQRLYRGNIDPDDLADVLVARFNHGNMVAQKVGRGRQVMVQIGIRRHRSDPGRAALSVGINAVEEGVQVSMGQQRWLDAAASLAQTGLGAWFNPFSLIGRLDDIARDVSNLTLPDQVWEAVEQYARGVGGELGLAETQTVVTCPYCGVGNPVGEGECSACGAPLGDYQPITCPQCGLVLQRTAYFCSRCGTRLRLKQ